MKAYIYCTKAKPYLYHDEDYCFDTMNTIDLGYKTFEYANQRVYDDETGKFLGWEKYGNMYKGYALNGKIVAEFDLNKVEKIRTYLDNCYDTKSLGGFALQSRSCLNAIELDDYLKNKGGYAFHIKNLHIFDEPMELSDFEIEKAPQSWQFVRNIDNELCILISIKPEWVCKILNREKTIEVRKTCPREFIKECKNND